MFFRRSVWATDLGRQFPEETLLNFDQMQVVEFELSYHPLTHVFPNRPNLHLLSKLAQLKG